MVEVTQTPQPEPYRQLGWPSPGTALPSKGDVLSNQLYDGTMFSAKLSSTEVSPAEAFCAWLEGFLDACGDNSLNKEKVNLIKNKLKSVNSPLEEIQSDNLKRILKSA